MAGQVFNFPDKGSRVLREFNASRQRERAVRERLRADKRAWYDGVVGQGVAAGFAGASISRLTANLAQWSGALNADLDNSLVILRARARQLCQGNEHGKRFLSLVAANVIGPKGPALQVRVVNGQGNLDKRLNDVVEMGWAKWCQYADVSGLMDFAHLQRVGVSGSARDGEGLIRFVRRFDMPNGLGLQLLEADRLDEAMNGRLKTGNGVRLGVEIDSLRRPQAYYVKEWHPGDREVQALQAKLERVPADQLLHPFLPVRAEQVRGYTWFHAVLLRAQMLHEWEESAVVAARIGASKVAAFTRKDDGAGPGLAEQLADGKDESTGALQMNAQAGEFFDLTGMPGVSLESWNPEYPHANFDSFLKACLRGVASGLDVADHNLTGDMNGVNYSSARIAELSEREQWQVLQSWWIRAVTMPTFKAWLEMALIKGDLRYSNGSPVPADKLSAILEASSFLGRRWAWVDPKADMAAAEIGISLGLTSRTRLAAEQGREVEDVIAELAQEKTLLEKAGLPWQVGKAATLAPADPGAAGASQDAAAE